MDRLKINPKRLLLPAASAAGERFLPDFRSLGTTFALLLLGEILAFTLTLASVSTVEKFWADLGLTSFYILWVVLLSQAVLALFNNRLGDLSAASAGWWVFLTVVAASFVATALDYMLWPEIDGGRAKTTANLIFNLLGRSVVAGLVTAVGLHLQYEQYLRRLQTRAEGSARLDALQSRMRPHFLFNSLNAIASLIRRDPLLAEELTLDLAELFRAILSKDLKLSTLEEECALSRQYLNIERQRLGDRLLVVWKLDEDVADAMLPPLSLQPLIENAIYHGIELASAGGRLEITSQAFQKSELMLTVRNTLPEEAKAVERPGNRMALKNLRLRLQAVYGEQGQLKISRGEGHYSARIIIPYRSKRKYEDSPS